MARVSGQAKQGQRVTAKKKAPAKKTAGKKSPAKTPARAKLPEEVKDLADKCIPKHVEVIQAVLSGEYKTNDAAYRSVYKTSSAATSRANVSSILSLTNNKALMTALRDLRLLEGALSRAEAIGILSGMARTTIGDLVEFGTYDAGKDDDGSPVTQSTWKFKNSDKLSEEALRSISELTAGPQGLKIKQHDQKAALKQLGELLGWNEPSKIELSGTLAHTSEEMSLEEATRIFDANLKAIGNG